MSFQIGLAGMQAATRRLDAPALDGARASAQGAGRAPSARPADAPPEAGPDAASGATPGAMPRTAGQAAAPVPAADIDLPAAMVGVISASNAVLANLQTIRRADEALRTLLEPRR